MILMPQWHDISQDPINAGSEEAISIKQLPQGYNIMIQSMTCISNIWVISLKPWPIILTIGFIWFYKLAVSYHVSSNHLNLTYSNKAELWRIELDLTLDDEEHLCIWWHPPQHSIPKHSHPCSQRLYGTHPLLHRLWDRHVCEGHWFHIDSFVWVIYKASKDKRNKVSP